MTERPARPRISLWRIFWPVLILGVIPFVWAMGWFSSFRFARRFPRSSKLGPYVWYYLPTGWWKFLQRNVPAVSPEFSAIALTALCAGIAFVVLHFLARSFSQSWRWRSTLAVLLAPALLFAIVLAAAGTRARITELATDPEPVRGVSFVDLEELRQIDSAVDQFSVETAPAALPATSGDVLRSLQPDAAKLFSPESSPTPTPTPSQPASEPPKDSDR
jgi:hypothetical protein